MKQKIELDWKTWPEVPQQSDLPILVKGECELNSYHCIVPKFLSDPFVAGSWKWASLRINDSDNVVEFPDPLATWPHVKAIREASIAASGATSAEDHRRRFNEAFLKGVAQ